MVTVALGLVISLVAAVHAQIHVHHRQAPPSPSPPAGPPISVPAPSGTGVGTGTATPAPASTSPPPTFPVNIPSTNPTAIPIASIVVNESSIATTPLDTTFAAGAQPTAVSGAPPLPDISRLSPANYPPLDKPPPIDSPEVQQWIQQVNSSGFFIPNIPPNLPGGCSANPAAVADTSRCWWACSQCTRATDIITCPDKFTWGSSFDDGPAPYTPNLTHYLSEQNIKTTFFVVGSRVISRPDCLRTQYMAGHQIAVHTWSHTPLTTQSTSAIIAELGWSKKVIKDVIGVTPNVFRPPFGDIDDRVRAIGAAMGLTAIIWTSGTSSNHVSFDTGDFNIGAGTISSSGVIRNFNAILGNASIINTGFIVLEHDLFPQSVDIATGYIIPEALAMNFKLMPIVQCLKKLPSDAYIETNNNQTNPPPAGSGTSIVGGAASTATSSTKKSDAVGASVFNVWGAGMLLLSALLGSAVGLG